MSFEPNEEFELTIARNWAAYFGCPPAILLQPGVTLRPMEKYAGDRVIVLLQLSGHTYAEFDPAYAAMLERVVAGLPPKTPLNAADLVRKLGGDAFEGQDLNLIHYLYGPDLPDYAPPAPFAVRQLTRADASALQALHDACTPEEVDDALVEARHEVVFGCFAGDQLVAAASGRRRSGFLDTGVLTHPSFRDRGLGRAVVGAMCAWSSENDLIAQFRCRAGDRAPLALAKALNFRLYFHSESLWLEGR